MKIQALAAAILMLLPAGGNQVTKVDLESVVIEQLIEREDTKPKWSKEELQAIACTLAGECYNNQEQDKRLVCEVILNRVSDGRFGDSICGVLMEKNQFAGYWHQSRPVSENDLAVAEQALNDWFNNGCKPLSKYLFFCAGSNCKNSFY